MSYVIYPLHFRTAVRFGVPGRGGRLDEACMEYPADILFGALCAELAAAGEEESLVRLAEEVERGDLRLSDLLPWQNRKSDGAMALFLPRPVLRVERKEREQREDYRTTCANATLRKKQKKLKYIRASRMQDYIRAMERGIPFEENDFDADFGIESLRQRVNRRGEEPLPYYVAQFDFRTEAGLYLIACVRDEKTTSWLHRLLVWLGTAGIGGKRTSGYGKFRVGEIIHMDANDGGDIAALGAMLAADSAPWQLALAPVLPAADDLAAVKAGAYRLRRAGGFISYPTHAAEKKNSVYLLDAGSCFPVRIGGTCSTLGTHDGHPVWRYGYGLYAGVTT